MADTNLIAATPVQKVVVVNGNTEVLGMLETVLDAGRYDMVFVESSDRAYSQIKKVRPNLVILCTRIEELEGFQLLTMLKLDAETKDVPILTYTTEYEGQDFDSAGVRCSADPPAAGRTTGAARLVSRVTSCRWSSDSRRFASLNRGEAITAFFSSGVAHSPVRMASWSSSMSKRSGVGGKGMAYAVCSASYQPAPMPSSIRPPHIWST